MKGFKIGALALVISAILTGCGSSDTKEPPVEKVVEQPTEAEKPKEPSPEEIEAKRVADEQAAEARRRAEEERAIALERERQLAAENRRRLDEERNARLNDFNERFVEALGVSSVGAPKEQRNDAIIYSLDQSGELHLSQKITGNKFTGIYINVKEARQDTVFAALVFYEAAIKAYNPYADPNAVFRALGLDANLVDDLPNPKSANINGITYSKKMIGKSLSLGINS